MLTPHPNRGLRIIRKLVVPGVQSAIAAGDRMILVPPHVVCVRCGAQLLGRISKGHRGNYARQQDQCSKRNPHRSSELERETIPSLRGFVIMTDRMDTLPRFFAEVWQIKG